VQNPLSKLSQSPQLTRINRRFAWRDARLTSVALTAALSVAFLACGEDDRRGRGTGSNALTIATASLPDIHVGQAYDQKIKVSGGEPPYRFELSEGQLPDTLELKKETGQVFGLAATPGSKSFTIKVSDKADATASKQLSIYVSPDPLQILTTRLNMGQEGVEYSERLSAQGGIPPRVWTVIDGALPQGVSINEEGLFSGTPTEFGSFDFTVQVQDTETSTAKQSLQLYLLAINPMITSTDIPKARQDQPYVNRFMAEGGMPPYRWNLEMSNLPSGIGLAEGGLMAGTPTVAGTFRFVVKVTDSADRTGEAQFDLLVIEPLRITTTALPAVIRNRVYEQQIEALGGVPPYEWNLRTGDIPPGFTFSESGMLSGMTQVAGDYAFSVGVRDSEGSQKLALFDITVSDRFTYKVEPGLNFPLVCTSTHVSYAVVPINVMESMQIADINVEVDVDYRDRTEPSRRDNERLKLVLFAPDGSPTALCGNGAGIRGWRGCDGGGGIQTTYGSVSQSDRPLEALRGTNPQGEWRFAAVVTKPSESSGGNCEQSGTINSITLSIRDERSMDNYIYIRGFTKNNLVVEPWVRIGGSGRMNGEIYLSATMYDVGPNGYPEGGAGDDLPQAASLTWTFAGGPELATVTPDGHVVSGDTPGDAALEAEEPGGLKYQTRLLVLPPDWNVLRRNY